MGQRLLHFWDVLQWEPQEKAVDRCDDEVVVWSGEVTVFSDGAAAGSEVEEEATPTSDGRRPMAEILCILLLPIPMLALN